MPFTQEDIVNFGKFASARIRNGGAELTIHELVDEWCAQKEREDVLADIKQGRKDHEDGKGEPLEKVMRELRSHLGIVQ
jgi:hypothetical protein